MTDEINKRLEELRATLRAENISQGELIELQGLAEHIDPGDVELLEAAGVPEFPEDPEIHVRADLWVRRVAGESTEDAVRQYMADCDVATAFVEVSE